MCYTEFGREQILAATIPHIEKYPSLYGFTSSLLDAINTSHGDRLWPLTVRHAAQHTAPAYPDEMVTDREHRVFMGFKALAEVGLLRAVSGPDGKVLDRGDYLQSFVLEDSAEQCYGSTE